jgi:hypothetical protein
MSLGFFPAFNPEIPSLECEALGEVFLAEIKNLDKIASANGIAKISNFADCREVPEDFDGPPEELEEAMGVWNDWFPAKDGRLAMEKLAELISRDKKVQRKFKTPEALIAELREFTRVLETAEAKGTKFRLEVG